MIKLYLILLILIFLTILISKKEHYTTCHSNLKITGPLLINGGLINDKIYIFWNSPDGLSEIENLENPIYNIIYNTNDSKVTSPVVKSNNIIKEITPTILTNLTNSSRTLYSYNMKPLHTLNDGEYYNITLNMTIKKEGNVKEDGATGFPPQTLSSNTLVINKTNNNPMIHYLSNPNDVFANLKNKSIDIII